MDLKNTVAYLPIKKYKFVLQLKEGIIFPDFKGSKFRRGFGKALKKISCVKKKSSCETCVLKPKCVYEILFEAKISNKEYKLLGLAEPPRPFVLEPPLDKKKKYDAGEKFELDVLIFGNSIQFLPYIIFTFNELGKKGIGETKAKYELFSVETVDGKLIYEPKAQTFFNHDSTINLFFDENNNQINQIKIKFLTPTRVKTEGKSEPDIPFQTLIKSLIRRLVGLLIFYTDKNLEYNFDYIINDAAKIVLQYSNLKWVEVERYVTQQNTIMRMKGFIGEVVYQGDLTKFYPLLKIGEYIHVGKNTTFGLGKYEIVKI
jgi:CRISPR-associated endoribonuclease Cas6